MTDFTMIKPELFIRQTVLPDSSGQGLLMDPCLGQLEKALKYKEAVVET